MAEHQYLAVHESLLGSGGGVDVMRGEGEGCGPHPRRGPALWGSLAHSSMLDSDTGDGGMERAEHRYGSSNDHVWGHIHDPPHYSGDPLGDDDDNRRGDDNSNHHGDSMDGKSCDADFHHHGDGGGPVSAHFFVCDSAYLQSYDGRLSAGIPVPLDCGDLVGHRWRQLLSPWSCLVQWLCGCPDQLQGCGTVSGEEGSQWEHNDLSERERVCVRVRVWLNIMLLRECLCIFG